MVFQVLLSHQNTMRTGDQEGIVDVLKGPEEKRTHSFMHTHSQLVSSLQQTHQQLLQLRMCV